METDAPEKTHTGPGGDHNSGGDTRVNRWGKTRNTKWETEVFGWENLLLCSCFLKYFLISKTESERGGRGREGRREAEKERGLSLDK